MLLLIDNYDSFTYNLLHYLGELGAKVDVVRNDKITVSDIGKIKNLQGIIISPGPCTPDDAGICLEAVKTYAKDIPMLGVCLGHQIIAQAFGAKIIQAAYPVHGKVSTIINFKKGLLANLPDTFNATRYHSLIIDAKTLPGCFNITAENSEGIIMAISHKEYNIHGVQFHPESIASEQGHELLAAFLKRTKVIG